MMPTRTSQEMKSLGGKRGGSTRDAPIRGGEVDGLPVLQRPLTYRHLAAFFRIHPSTRGTDQCDKDNKEGRSERYSFVL
jgi:hypothetical protein